jgi:hypothetical protein
VDDGGGERPFSATLLLVTFDLPDALRGRPFLLSEAVAAGLTAAALRHPRFRRPFRGVYVEAHLPDTVELRARAAGLLLPEDVVYSHHTAAGLLRLPVPVTTVVHVLGTKDRDTRGIEVHRISYAESDVLSFNGLRLTGHGRTWIDLAALLDLDDLVALGDAVLHRLTAANADVLLPFIAAARSRAGVLQARAAIPLLEPRTMAPTETWMRLTLMRAGLPRPESNLDVYDDRWSWQARPDGLYRDPPVALEYGGATHFFTPRERRKASVRNERLRELGYEVVVATVEDQRDPRDYVARVLAARARAHGTLARGHVHDRWPETCAEAAGPGEPPAWLDENPA